VTANLSACSTAGDLSVRNESLTDVTVSLGDERAEVTAGGGVAFLDYGCTPGDVTVEFPSGRSVVVPGPVCPEQEIVVRDGAVELEPAAARAT
jgi:hypothetical protein